MFIKGLQLSQMFYEEVVKDVLAASFPNLNYSAALIGTGSEILGFDTAQSTDHHWGPRLMLFLSETDYPLYKTKIIETFQHNLPYTFHGYSTNYTSADTVGVQLLQEISSGLINHRIEPLTTASYFDKYLGVNPLNELTLIDWLSFPQQKLRTIVAGQVYHDGLGELTPIRQKLAYYPHEIWLYLLSVQWRRISQEEPFMARCGDVGDELGSQIVAARLIRELMRLAFLLEKEYAPYTKWFGTGFSKLKCASELSPIFEQVLKASNWKEREAGLSQAYNVLAGLHNTLDITKPMPTEVSSFHERPYLVIHSELFADEIRKAIKDPDVLKLMPFVGSLDQFVDSTDVLSYTEHCTKLKYFLANS